MSNTVIKTEHLSKYYKLGVINNGTLFRDIQTWWALKRGKADPHGQIGSHRFDNDKEGFWALDDVNFEIKQGDRVGIIGHNGAGKSTLLKILSRITAPTEGKVKIKGRVSSLLEVGTGFHGELTGRENIYLNGAILGMKRREVDRKIDEIIAFSEIEKYIDTPVKRYSSGMYVRLAFAVAAHLDSEILIADEVLAVGDATFQKKALGKMNELSAGEGRTVLFVSHNMAQVKNLCNKGIVLEKGRIVRQDDDIDKSINYYLNNGKTDIPDDIKTVSWYNDGSKKNVYMTPLSIEILDSEKKLVTGALSSDEQYYIKYRFSVKQKSVKPLCYGLKVMSGLTYVTTFSRPLESYDSGEYEVWFTINPALLPLNSYRLILSASVWETEWIFNGDYNEVVALFEIERGEKYSALFTGEVVRLSDKV
ncbi:MAG: polysaccharide ABC transporter ATP-binding protein [Treponema sp.]